MGRVGFRGITRPYAFLLVRPRSGASPRCDTTPATRMRHFRRISSAIASSRSRSVRLCYKNARSVTSGQFIAERRLLYSQKGSDVRKEFVIRIGLPYTVKGDMVGYPVGDGVAGCHVEIEGLNETCSEVYGADSLQAVNIASNVEPFLKRLQRKYDLYWLSGDPYFDTSE
jgi:hypothetical protein